MKKAFTLAEVLITLAIIGVVAALTIPSVVANTQQQEFKTGLRKAVSVLNSAITMNMAIDGESPYENRDLYHYLGRHMSIMKSYALAPITPGVQPDWSNAAFYTTDGMRFEFLENASANGYAQLRLYENPSIILRGSHTNMESKDRVAGTFKGLRAGCDGVSTAPEYSGSQVCSHCGSYGLASNTDNTKNSPCLVVVDVNGDRKPFPKNASCFSTSCQADNIRKYGDPSGRKLTDTFAIMITDKAAIPYGMAAQKAMYEAQKQGK